MARGWPLTIKVHWLPNASWLDQIEIWFNMDKETTQEQMSERGFPVAGAGTAEELRGARQLAVDDRGSSNDGAKMGSSSYRGAGNP